MTSPPALWSREGSPANQPASVRRRLHQGDGDYPRRARSYHTQPSKNLHSLIYLLSSSSCSSDIPNPQNVFLLPDSQHAASCCHPNALVFLLLSPTQRSPVQGLLGLLRAELVALSVGSQRKATAFSRGDHVMRQILMDKCF